MLSMLRHAGFAAVLLATTTSSAFADTVVASEADAGKTVSVHMGQTLTINLTGAHASGKYWRLNADLTPELILSGRTTQAVDLPGAPETTSYSFTTTAPGTLMFKASYIATGAPIPKTDDVAFTVNVVAN